MKKHLLPMLLSCFIVLLSAACSSNDSGGAASGSASANSLNSSAVELIVWESADGSDEFIKQAAEKFTANNPNITINFVNVEIWDSSEQIAIYGPEGTGPDLFAAPHTKLGELVTGGHVAGVQETAIRNTLVGCQKAVTYNDQTWGYPIASETYSLFYNKDLIAEPPATWEDVISFCADFNAANIGKYGFVMDVSAPFYTILFTSSNGNQLFGPNGTNAAAPHINSPDAAAGMQTFRKLRNVMDMPAADLETNKINELFQSGVAAMHITGPWNFSTFKDAGINFGVTSLPALPNNSSPAMSFSSTRCMFISNYSSNKAEAALFAEFLISSEMQSLRYDITGDLPSVNISLGGEYGEYAMGMLKQMDYAYPLPSIPEMSKYWEAMKNASVNIWDGDGSNIQSELDTADAIIAAG